MRIKYTLEELLESIGDFTDDFVMKCLHEEIRNLKDESLHEYERGYEEGYERGCSDTERIKL